MRGEPYPPRRHQTASTDGTAKAALTSAARSWSVPARYIVARAAFGIAFGTNPRETITSSAIRRFSESDAGLAGATSATFAPFLSAFGRITGKGPFSTRASVSLRPAGKAARTEAVETWPRNPLRFSMAPILDR